MTSSWAQLLAGLPLAPGFWLTFGILFLVLELINRRVVLFLPLTIASFALSAYIALSSWWSDWFDLPFLQPPQSVWGVVTLFGLITLVALIFCVAYQRRRRRRRARKRWIG